MSYLDIVNKVNEDFKGAELKMRKEGEKSLKLLFANLFRDLPEVDRVVWNHYTP